MVYDPRMGPGMGVGATSAAGGILDFLKQQYMQKMAGQQMAPYGPMSALTWPGGGGGGATAPGVSAAAPAAAPGPGQTASLSPSMWSTAQGIPMTPQGMFGGQATAGRAFGESGIPSPQTKTEPRAPLRFSWGSDAGVGAEGAVDYDPQNPPNLLQMKGAPTGGREGFMGAEPSDPMRSGGYVGPSGGTALEQYLNTANPAGFAGFHELPETEAIAKAAVNPNWQEVENIQTTERERGEQMRLTQQDQARIVTEAQDRFLQQAIQAALSMAQAEKGGEPLTQEEIDEVTQRTIYQQSQTVA